MVVRMSLMTLSSSATTSLQALGHLPRGRGQYGAQTHARAEDPLDHEIVEVAGDAITLLRHLKSPAGVLRPAGP